MSDEVLPEKENKVKDITKEKVKRAVKERKHKLPKERLYALLADAISRKAPRLLPPFKADFHVYEASPGVPLALAEGPDQEVTVVKDRVIADHLIRYTNAELGEFDDYQLTLATATAAKDVWLSMAPRVPRPSAVGWKGVEGLTFRRLPWALGRAPHPTWETMLGRMSNAQAFRHWLGALFFPQSSLHQYVWCFGEGRDGKGAMNRFLSRVFSQAYCSKQPPGRDDKFWTFGLIGKRLVVFPDCNSQAFVTSGLFKSLTGGDPIDVEGKWQPSFTYLPECKFLFFSNKRPEVTADTSDQRRIIYCEFAPRGDVPDDPEFEEALWKEGGAFLSSCMAEYLEAYPRHGQIATDTSKLTEWVEVQEERFQAMLESTFRISFKPDDRDLWVSGSELVAALCIRGRQPHPREVESFRSWLDRRYGIRRQCVRFGDKVLHRYKGLISIVVTNDGVATGSYE